MESTISRAPAANRGPGRPLRDKVLVLLHHDGWFEVDGERHVDACKEVVPTMSDHLVDKRDVALELLLPAAYRSLFWPNKLRAADMVRRVTPANLLARENSVATLRVLDGVARQIKEDVVRWSV